MAESQRGKAGGWEYLAWWREDGSIDLPTTRAHLPTDDLSASRLLAQMYPDLLHHAADAKRWHVWNGQCHQHDDSAAISRVIHHLATGLSAVMQNVRQLLLAEARNAMPGETDAKVSEAAEKQWKQQWSGPGQPGGYATALRGARGLSNLTIYLGGVRGISEADLEAAGDHPFWVNNGSGTLELATDHGVVHPVPWLRGYQPSDMLTYCLEASYGQAHCPQFWALLVRACGGNLAIAEYVLKMLGYCLLGENPDQLVFFLRGPTAGGKTTLLDTVVKVLGPLARESSVDLVTVRRDRNARTENSIRGMRLVTITETSGHLLIDEAQLKRLTGEKTIVVHRHYASEQLRTRVTWVIIIATNEMPVLSNPDKATQRRMRIVPMGPSLPEWQWDKHLSERIVREERDGVFSMLVQAAMHVLQHGLVAPPEVVDATMEYATAQDTVGAFLADCCEVVASYNGQGPARTNQHDVWRAYEWYTREAKWRLPKQEFKRQFSERAGIWVNEPARTYDGVAITQRVKTEMGW